MRAWPLILAATTAAACAPPGDMLEEARSELSAAQRRSRAGIIRDVAFMNGLTNPVLLGGIGDAETGLAHCWSEATWACQGPASASCNGGPVIAGSGDGPCALREGGLGLFQFDGGTFDQTLARDGREVLELEGNIAHAVAFVTGMVVRSQFISGVDTEAQALAWMNAVPIQPGDARYEAWVSTVTRHYNGCSPNASCWASRRARYEERTRSILGEFGADFWGSITLPPAPCPKIPAEGRTIAITDGCYTDGGMDSGWREEAGVRWTYASNAAAEDNFADWNLDFAQEGTYRVEVETLPGPLFQSKSARYVVQGSARREVVIDQTAGHWQSLGEHAFDRGRGEQRVHLGDVTGEPYASRVKLGFGAIRVTRVRPPPPPLGAPAIGDPPSEAIAPGEVAAPVPVEPAPIDPPAVGLQGRVSGQCACTAARSIPAPLALALPLVWALVTRVRSGRARR